MRNGVGAAITILAAAIAAPAAAETCKVGKMAELAVTMQGLRPIVQTTINGKPAPFIVDSGAFFSTISPPVAKALDLPAVNMPGGGLRLRGIGGTSDASVARVRHFGLAGFDLNDVQFVVGGTDVGQTGLLGQNVLGLADVEYDLPDGAVRLFKTTGCGKTALAYWSAGKPFFTLPIESKEAARNHTVGAVELDGAKLRATFDTGAAQTVVTLRAAAKAGVHPGDPGVETAGWQTGLGRRVVQGWIGKFAVVKIGDEELHNVRLRIADLGDLDTDMLIGADYFISHRIFVSNTQRRMYFTYTGGRLFDMGAHVDPAGSVVASGAPEAAPTDADGWARRAAMFQTQRDLPRAIDAYTQAITLAPKDPRFPRQRALVYLAQRRPVLALDDLNTTLTLDPSDLEAQLIRAQVRLRAGNPAGAISDLDAISARLPREDARRMVLGQLYSAADAFDAAIGQYDSWLATHRDDAHRSQAQNGRCWARVLANRDLDKARGDCDAAVRAVPSNPSFLDSRGLVALRQGDDAAASRDFAAALAINPKLGWSLYGRSVVERHQGQMAQADADLAAARAVDRTLPDRAKRYGL